MSTKYQNIFISHTYITYTIKGKIESKIYVSIGNMTEIKAKGMYVMLEVHGIIIIKRIISHLNTEHEMKK